MYLHSQFGNTDAHHQGLEIPQWVISLFLLYLVNSSVGFRAKAKVNEILKFTSFKVVIPEHVLKDLDAKTESRLVRYPGTFKVHLFFNERPEKLTKCFFLHFGGMTAQKPSRRVCRNSRNAVTWWRNMSQETVWTELQHDAEATEGKSALALMLVELLKHEVIIRMLYVEMICRYIIYIYLLLYIDLYAWYTYLRYMQIYYIDLYAWSTYLRLLNMFAPHILCRVFLTYTTKYASKHIWIPL